MILKYTGPKPKKVVTWMGKEIVFTPTAEFNEIFDKPLIDWLLHPERDGLFVVSEVKDKTPSKTQPRITESMEKKPVEKTTPEPPKEEPQKSKKRGRKKKG